MGNLCSQLKVHDSEVHQVNYRRSAFMGSVAACTLVQHGLRLSDHRLPMQSGQVGSEPAGVVTLEPTQCSGYSDSSPTRHSNMSLLEEDDTPSQATVSGLLCSQEGQRLPSKFAGCLAAAATLSW